jgi:hypothetical protein
MWLYYLLFGAVIMAVSQDRNRLREIWDGLTQRLSAKLLIGGLAIA